MLIFERETAEYIQSQTKQKESRVVGTSNVIKNYLKEQVAR